MRARRVSVVGSALPMLCAGLVLLLACCATRDDTSGADQLERLLARDRFMATPFVYTGR